MTGKDLLTRLADAGEEAIAKLADTPGAERFMGTIGTMRDRVDELQRRVRGIDDLERRVAALEARFAEPPATTSAPSEAAGMTAPAASARTGAAGTEPTAPDSPG